MKTKVLFVTYKLQNYRIPIFNLIGKSDNIDLTVAHSAKRFDNPDNSFKEITLKYKSIGPFTYYDSSFRTLVNNFDVVVCMFYLVNLSFFKLVLTRNRSYRLIFWGIGVRASYDHEFDAPTIFNQLRYYWAKRSDAMIFYSNYARNKYIKKGFPADKLFVMHNTVEVMDYVENESRRKDLLFIGSLYKSKKIFELLDAYNNAKSKTKKLPRLQIVGDGDEYDNIKKWIVDTDNAESITLHGAIYEESKLAEIFTESIACISPGQAGLSVLKSFGYGVPFISSKNAITGGERLNIVHNKNGILFTHHSELENIIIDIAENPDKYMNMGKNAKQFYETERTPEIMADGFIRAAGIY